jgi:hypothetical protein
MENSKEQKTSSLKKYALYGVIGVIALILIGNSVGKYNTEIDLRSTFEAKIKERTAFYDKMSKIISQKAQIAQRNDSSFKDVVNAIMEGRQDGPNVMFKFVQESNPAATFPEVSKLFADLSRTVESERQGFFDQERVLEDIEKQHKVLLRSFPANMLFKLYGTEPLVYEPIQSSATKKVMQTGIDDNTKVF